MSDTADEIIKAMRKKDLPKVRALVSASAGAVNELSDSDGGSPFHVACRDGRREFALFFLEHGASLTVPDAESLSPLHLVIGAGGGWISTLSQAQVDDRTAMAEALMKGGAKLTEDLLLNACQMGGGKARKLATALLARNAPLTGQDDNGATVLHSAVEYDHPEVFAAALKLAEIAFSFRPVSPSGVEGLCCSRNSHLYKRTSTPLGQNGVSILISINPASGVEGLLELSEFAERETPSTPLAEIGLRLRASVCDS